jgi:hypothetical protein
MTLSQHAIDFTGHRKRYFVALPQLRNAVQPDTMMERLHSERPYFSRWQKWFMTLFIGAAVLFLLLAGGAFDNLMKGGLK